MNHAIKTLAKGTLWLSLFAVIQSAAAAGLVDAWRAAVQNDKAGKGSFMMIPPNG